MQLLESSFCCAWLYISVVCVNCDAYLWGHILYLLEFLVRMWNCGTWENVLNLWWLVLFVVLCQYLWWLVLLWMLLILGTCLCLQYFGMNCFFKCCTCGGGCGACCNPWPGTFVQVGGSFPLLLFHPVCCHGEVGCSQSWNSGGG